MKHSPRWPICLLSLTLLIFVASGCSGRDSKPQNTGEQLLEASKSAGVQVNTEEVFTISRGAETVAVAPIAGWERVPATDLRKGTDVAFAYFSASEPKVPAGHYTLRAFADVNGVGTMPARIQLVDREGRVAGEIAAEVEVHSLTVPAEAASLRTFVTVTDDRVVSEAAHVAVGGGTRPRVWIRCPNGVCLRWATFTPRRLPPFAATHAD